MSFLNYYYDDGIVECGHRKCSICTVCGGNETGSSCHEHKKNETCICGPDEEESDESDESVSKNYPKVNYDDILKHVLTDEYLFNNFTSLSNDCSIPYDKDKHDVKNFKPNMKIMYLDGIHNSISCEKQKWRSFEVGYWDTLTGDTFLILYDWRDFNDIGEVTKVYKYKEQFFPDKIRKEILSRGNYDDVKRVKM